MALDDAARALGPGGPLYLPFNVALIVFFNYYYTFLQVRHVCEHAPHAISLYRVKCPVCMGMLFTAAGTQEHVLPLWSSPIKCSLISQLGLLPVVPVTP